MGGELKVTGSLNWIISPFTCFDDVAQLIEQEFVVSSSVQALLHVAVEFVHHALHICVLVLLDTRTHRNSHKHWDWILKYCNYIDKEVTKAWFLYSTQSIVTAADTVATNAICNIFFWMNERGIIFLPFTKTVPFITTLPCTPPMHSPSLLHSSTGIHPRSHEEATGAPQLWLEPWQALLLSFSFKVWLRKRQTSCLVRGQRAVYFCACREGEDRTAGRVAR